MWLYTSFLSLTLTRRRSVSNACSSSSSAAGAAGAAAVAVGKCEPAVTACSQCLRRCQRQFSADCGQAAHSKFPIASLTVSKSRNAGNAPSQLAAHDLAALESWTRTLQMARCTGWLGPTQAITLKFKLQRPEGKQWERERHLALGSAPASFWRPQRNYRRPAPHSQHRLDSGSLGYLELRRRCR